MLVDLVASEVQHPNLGSPSMLSSMDVILAYIPGISSKLPSFTSLAAEQLALVPGLRLPRRSKVLGILGRYRPKSDIPWCGYDKKRHGEVIRLRLDAGTSKVSVAKMACILTGYNPGNATLEIPMFHCTGNPSVSRRPSDRLEAHIHRVLREWPPFRSISDGNSFSYRVSPSCM